MKLYEGLKVVEFTTNIAGPTVGQWLAEYGAEVIHIERPVIGDDSRAYPPLVNGISIKYCTLNHGKKSVILDLKDPDGNKIACELCKDADILLESTRPGVMDRLGLGYETMHELNPRLIYCSVSAWGQTGPYAHRPGYDLIAQGASSIMYYNGDDETGPVKIFTEIGDQCGGLAGFAAVNAALYYRERTGLGQHVDISLVRVLASMSVKLDDLRILHKKTEKQGNQGSPLLCPYGVFKCPDGNWIIIAASNNALAFQFFRVIGREDLISDPRFETNVKRVEHQKILAPIMYEWFDKMGTIDNIEKALLEGGVPCSRVYSYEDVDKDPHYHEAGWFTDIPMPEEMTNLKARRIVSSPFGFSEMSPEYIPTKGFGAWNHEIIGKLGYTPEQIDELQEKWKQAMAKN